ncbi:adenosylcobinamide-GDP ribazoletransferase [Salinisphaera orenii]
MLAAAIAAGAAWRGLWQRRIGGYTGDVVGGLIECVELAVVVAAALTV